MLDGLPKELIWPVWSDLAFVFLKTIFLAYFPYFEKIGVL
jgi:hypothetical protein